MLDCIVGEKFNRIKLVKNSQVAANLLRFCAGASRVVHLSKVFPTDQFFWGTWSGWTRPWSSFQVTSGLILTPSAKRQLFLPVATEGSVYLQRR